MPPQRSRKRSYRPPSQSFIHIGNSLRLKGDRLIDEIVNDVALGREQNPLPVGPVRATRAAGTSPPTSSRVRPSPCIVHDTNVHTRSSAGVNELHPHRQSSGSLLGAHDCQTVTSALHRIAVQDPLGTSSFGQREQTGFALLRSTERHQPVPRVPCQGRRRRFRGRRVAVASTFLLNCGYDRRHVCG